MVTTKEQCCYSICKYGNHPADIETSKVSFEMTFLFT